MQPLALPAARRGHRRHTPVLALAAALLVSGCATDSPSAVLDTAPAALAVRAVVPRTETSAGPAAVRITVAYLRQSGAPVTLGSPQTFALDQSSQQVPVAVDVATCLGDATRAGTGSAAPAADECNVQLTLEFLLNGVRVDQQVLTNVSVKPGRTSTVAETVALAQVADVRVVLPRGQEDEPALRVERGATAQLGIAVVDNAGQAITGRVVTWTSSNPAVATVNALGLVTGVGVGTTQLTASVAGRDVPVNTVVTVPSQLITVVAAGASGRGTVQSNPAGLDCRLEGTQATGSCEARFPGDIMVQLVASAGANAEFVSFSGDCATTQGSACTVAPTAPRRVAVSFRNRLALSVAGAGNGHGVVSADAADIACTLAGSTTTGTCSSPVSEGRTVVLTASATGSSLFDTWTGECSSISGATCTVTMDRARTVAPRFVSTGTLTVRGHGTGEGTVTGAPGDIACVVAGSVTGGTCTASYLAGTVVTLHTAVVEGNTFTGWSGACTGTGNCTVTIADAKEVRAEFTRTGVPLTINVEGPGGGSIVTSTGSTCVSTGSPRQCVVFLPPNTTVSLNVNTGLFLLFDGFSGACGTAGVCQLVMSEPRTVTATFRSRTATMFMALAGTGGGTVSTDANWACTLAVGQKNAFCSSSLVAGRAVRFTAQPEPGSVFTGWSGACSGMGECVVAADNTAVNAGFRQVPVTVRVLRDAAPGGSGQVVFGSPSNRCTITSTGTAGTCTVDVAPGTVLTFAIDPSVGFPFVSWGGDCASAGSTPVCTLTARDSNITVTARFQSPP